MCKEVQKVVSGVLYERPRSGCEKVGTILWCIGDIGRSKYGERLSGRVMLLCCCYHAGCGVDDGFGLIE